MGLGQGISKQHISVQSFSEYEKQLMHLSSVLFGMGYNCRNKIVQIFPRQTERVEQGRLVELKKMLVFMVCMSGPPQKTALAALLPNHLRKMSLPFGKYEDF